MGDRNHRQIRDVLLSVQHELSRHLTKAADCGEYALADRDAVALSGVRKAVTAVNDWIELWSDEHEALADALVQLDGSEDMGDGPPPGT